MASLILPIPGTHAWSGAPTLKDWYHPESAWSKYVATRGLLHLSPARPFVWSTDLDGLDGWLRWLHLKRNDKVDWQAAGLNLWSYFEPAWLKDAPATNVNLLATLGLAIEHRNLISHSHGLQPVLFACAAGLKIRRLISIAGPVRSDMMEVATRARPNIERWLHVCSDNSDAWQWLGEIGDGVLGIVRQHPLADVNLCVPAVGHSGLVEDEDAFHLWADDGLIDFITTGLLIG